MSDLRIYLDNCCFNRPFDDQGQVRIRIETEAKLYLQRRIENGDLELVWSYILDFENAANPFEIRKTSISKWKRKASEFVNENNELIKLAKEHEKSGFKAKDALHIASAKHGNCDYFITTDDKILNKSDSIVGIDMLNPIDLLKIIED